MDREQAKELWPIIKAYAEGKQIEIKPKVEGSYWNILEEDDMQHIDFKKCDLRIKPEPKYRSFKNREECWKEMQRHQPIGWVTTGKLIFNVITLTGDGVVIHNGVINSRYRFEKSLQLKFVDGEPFGIIEDYI